MLFVFTSVDTHSNKTVTMTRAATTTVELERKMRDAGYENVEVLGMLVEASEPGRIYHPAPFVSEEALARIGRHIVGKN
jgi:hypothetical protein